MSLPEQALIFTDDPQSATEIAESQKQSTPIKARRPMSLPLLGHDLGINRDLRQPSQPVQEMSHER
jgi:hypothetical protein